MRAWTKEQDDLFREFYPNSSMAEMKVLLRNKTECAIYNRSETLNVRKSADYLKNMAYRFNGSEEKSNANRFKKGQIPFNKGIKGINYEGMQATQFTKGSKPANYKPVGTIRETVDGYLEMKMQDGMQQWKLLQRVIWERLNGAIPKNYITTFLDGDKKNLEITNLAIFSRRENMLRNTVHNYPKEIVHLVQLKAALNRQINKRTQA